MKKKVLLSIGGVIGLIIIGLLIFVLLQWMQIRKDFKILQTEEYDTILLSMYPVEHYEEEDYLYFRGMTVAKMSYEIPHGKVARWYLRQAKKSENAIARVYVGIDPERASTEDVVKMIQRSPHIFFDVTFPYPEVGYWTKMSESKFEKVMRKYREMAEGILALDNADLYSFGSEEWLVANPKNYVGECNTNEAVSEFLMCNTDFLHPYGVNYENLEAHIMSYHALYDKYKENAPQKNAAGLEIVFFGDSIIGNFSDSLSVPEVVSGLSGATVYNLGYGGKSAAQSKKTKISFPQVTQAFVDKDTTIFPEDTQVYAGLNHYIENGQEEAPKMFIINYGLNDYFDGLPVESEDKYDIRSYAGALRTGIENLKKSYPKAQILLLSPHFTAGYNFGQEIRSENGGRLEDYANAAVLVAEETGVDLLDNFHEFPVTKDNWRDYQPDETHLNEKGRFILGERITQRINNGK